MIEITNTSELRQLESGDFKAAVYFSQEFAEKFLAMKRRSAETGRKLALVETFLDQMEVKPLQPHIVDEVRKSAQGIIDALKEYSAGSIGVLPASAVPLANDDGPGENEEEEKCQKQ